MDYLNRIPASQAMAHLLLERRATDAPDAAFFSFLETGVTLGEFNRTVNRVARNLEALGVTHGTHVAVLMESSVEYMHLWFALSKLGAVEVPINTAYRGDLLRHVVATSQATVAAMDQRFREVVADAFPAGSPFSLAIVKGGGGKGIVSFADLYAPNEEMNLNKSLKHDEITGIIFTSGTTGPSKGVMLSHHYLTAYGLMYAEINGLKEDDVTYNFLPFFHIAAKFLTIATLACGGCMRLQARLSISSFWDEVRQLGVTNCLGVGGVCNMLISRPPSPDDANTSIRTIYAVPDPADIHEEIEHRFGCKMTTVYGSTEVGLPLFRGVGDAYKPGSCGRISPYYDVQIVDENDQPVPVGVTGEIVVRPKRPYLIGSGYIGMPERTIKAWRNLWLHTGDRGHVDEEGWFFFDDRASDSIRRRGENVSSFEVELSVAKHPAVAEAVAVAAPSELGEDEVRVLVMLRDGHSLQPEDLLQHCYRQMAYFMVPRYIDIVEDFPRTSTAKVEKYKIRAAGLGSDTWDREAAGWKVTRNGLVPPPNATAL
ncbi:crotonobetaine/carnitine-CoA ligase [Rhizobiales bacterium GAS113]|nr:crotonobetaine/carnitine-CoA ligase [Rhizobiales bacterium GAS113]